jgi:hypothetical protein
MIGVTIKSIIHITDESVICITPYHGNEALMTPLSLNTNILFHG